MVSDFARERLRPLAPGILLAFASIAFGFGLGIAFGAAEDDLKDHLQAGAQAVLESVYAGDESKAGSVVGKSWTYFKRAHLHANGLGTIALVGEPAARTARTSGRSRAAFVVRSWSRGALLRRLLAACGPDGAGAREHLCGQGIAGLARDSELRGLCGGPRGYADLFDLGDLPAAPRLSARGGDRRAPTISRVSTRAIRPSSTWSHAPARCETTRPTPNWMPSAALR